MSEDVLKLSTWRFYYQLCKPRVVALMLLTTVVGMLLASDGTVTWRILVFGIIGIGMMACAGGVFNHLIDHRIDAVMYRTKIRPIPSGRISPKKALLFGTTLGVIGLLVLLLFVNVLTAVLTFSALVGYALIYTMFLKRATPQNIVIGGLAGAAPPLLGWTTVTGQLGYPGLLLVLIIFTWTPAHFWPLCVYRPDDYAKVNIPMLAVTHGINFTKLSILLYTILLLAVSLLPFVVNMSGIIYLTGAIILGVGFLYWAIRLKLSEDRCIAIKTFHYSNFYLVTLFLLLLIDHCFLILI